MNVLVGFNQWGVCLTSVRRVDSGISARCSNLRATEGVHSLHAREDFAESPSSRSLISFLVVVFDILILVMHVVQVEIDEGLTLSHHPRQTDGGNLLVVISTSNVRVRPGKPHLTEGGAVILEFLP